MKKGIILVVFIFVGIRILGQVKIGSPTTVKPPPASVPASSSRPVKPAPSQLPVTKDEKEPYSYLLVSTDIDIRLTVNYSQTYYDVRATEAGRRIPLESGANVLKVIPLDGGLDGYTETIMLDKPGNRLFKVELGLKRSMSFTDSRDGKSYKTIKIGSQIWMAENLNYASTDSWCYDNVSANCLKFGRLYTFITARTICPIGWHLPSFEEWSVIIDFLGGEKVAGGKLKSTGTTLWSSPNESATNESGFSGLPGGYRFNSSEFSNLGSVGVWYSSSEKNSSIAWSWYLNNDLGVISVGSSSKENGLSVRCLRD